MAEEMKQYQQRVDEPCGHEATPVNVAEEGGLDVKDRGLFNFTGKKEEGKKVEEEVIVSEFEPKVQVCDEPVHKEEVEEKHGSTLEKLQRIGSSSSSSSDEEVEEGGVKIKKKKKKGLKEKVSGERKEEHKTQGISVPVEKCEESEEKKGFVGKIKEKLPGGHKKAEEVAAPPPPYPYQAPECTTPDAEAKEKKGFLDKIKEKIPGYHPKTEEEKAEKEKECK